MANGSCKPRTIADIVGMKKQDAKAVGMALPSFLIARPDQGLTLSRRREKKACQSPGVRGGGVDADGNTRTIP